MSKSGAVAALLSAAALVAGCAILASPLIDTWPVGDALPECEDALYCEAQIRVGLEGLDARDPGHAPVVSSELHRLGTCVELATGRLISLTYGGYGPDVLVVRLADGSTLAIGVGGRGIDPGPYASDWQSTCGVPPER